MVNYVEAAKSTIRGFANALNRAAVKNKAVAEELAFMHNIRSEITPGSVKTLTKDMFDKAGKMTKKGRKELLKEMQSLGLPKNATWDDIFSAAFAAKEKIALEIKLTPPLKKEFSPASLHELVARNSELKAKLKETLPPSYFAKLEEIIKTLPNKLV